MTYQVRDTLMGIFYISRSTFYNYRRELINHWTPGSDTAYFHHEKQPPIRNRIGGCQPHHYLDIHKKTMKTLQITQGLFCCVPGMAHLQLVKVQPRVFTAKCSETQVESSNAGMKEEASKTSEPTNRNPIRLNGGWGCNPNQSPKGKRKTKTVNWEVVEERRRCVLPHREILRTVKFRHFQTDMVKPVEKDLPQEVSWGHSRC